MTKNGASFDRCPKAFMRDDAAAELELVRDVFFLKKYQIWPVAGGLLDQPARFLEALELCERDVDILHKAQKAQAGGA